MYNVEKLRQFDIRKKLNPSELYNMSNKPTKRYQTQSSRLNIAWNKEKEPGDAAKLEQSPTLVAN